jgi:hypothetical protein
MIMELILLPAFVILLLIVGLIKLIESSQCNDDDTDAPKRPVQSMLFMSTALDVNDELTRGLSYKMSNRSLEIAKADGRFLVTPKDMKQAYNEIIREEHM